MKVNLLFSFILILLMTGIVPVNASTFSTDLLVGYNGGFGMQINGMVSEFASGFPLNLSFGLGYTSVNPGNAADARRIFINDATNGDPEKSGSRWDLRLDFHHKVNLLSLQRGYLYGGFRYAMFTGNFKFVGGNEDFDITSNQWGLGIGGKAFFNMGGQFDFVVSAGVDYFFASTLTGHDTSYSPDGENVNPRRDYTYDTADDAIDQPKFEVIFLIGINYRFK